MISLFSHFRQRMTKETGTQQVRHEEFLVNELQQVISMPKNGSVSITDNRITVTDPEEGGMYASVHIPDHPNVCVTLNGERVVGQVILTQTDAVQVKCLDQPTTVDTGLCVSADYLAVTMKVTIHRGARYKVEDCGPSVKALLRICEDMDIHILSDEQVMQKIADAGYVGTFDRDAIRTLCTEGGEAIVLRGTPASSGKPATFRRLPLPKEYDPLHRKMKLSAVAIGTPVAVLDPAIPGQSGRNVYGCEIAASAVGQPAHELGNGLILVNGLVVATIEGRLKWTKRRIDVIPELVIRKDITPRDGHIEFNGDLVVYGSVLDGSSIRVTGKVTVHGRVCGATLLGGGPILVAGNIVSSTVYAGQSQELYSNLLLTLKDIINGLERFSAEYKAILETVNVSSEAQSKIPMIGNRLFETRHQSLEECLSDLCTEFKRSLDNIDSRYHNLRNHIMVKWMGVQRTNIALLDIDYLRNIVLEYMTDIETNMSTELAMIRAMNITSSSLRASGTIYVNGSTYSSTIEGGDSIIVRGIVRGGFLISRNSAWIRELGTPAGVECSVRVSSRRGKIMVTERHPNTLIEVCGRRDRNLLFERKVQFKGGIA